MSTLPSSSGLLIVIEGIDGTGKSTQARRLAEALRARGKKVVLSREPTDGAWGQKIRRSYVEGRMSPADELAAFVEDRREHVAQVVRPALERGEVVVLDRYYYSTIAYQGVRGGDVGAIRAANEAFAPRPDVVLLIDVEPSAAVERIRSARGETPNSFEQVDQLKAVRGVFLQLAAEEPDRVRIIDGNRPPDDVFYALMQEVNDSLSGARRPHAALPPKSEEVRPAGDAAAAGRKSSTTLQLDFSTVRREIRGVVARRRELTLFLGSLFAAMGMLLQRMLDGELPDALKSIEHSAFFMHALLVLIPTTLLAMRIAKLHAGMIINGVFYAHAVHSLKPDAPSTSSAARLKWRGFSSSIFWLAAFLAGVESAVLVLSLHFEPAVAAAAGGGFFLLAVGYFLLVHRRARRFAETAILHCAIEPFSWEEVEDHLADSRSDANHDLITVVGFLGLMTYSILECITGLAKIQAQVELESTDVQRYGPWVYIGLLLGVCFFCRNAYLRLAVAIGDFSLALDPTDRPFKPFKLTDTMLGYLMVVFFCVVAVHLAAFACRPDDLRLVWAVDAAAAAVLAAGYPWRMWRAGRRGR